MYFYFVIHFVFLKNKQTKKEKALNKSIRIHFNKIKIKTIRKTHVTRHIWLDLLKLRPIKRREVHVRRTRNSMSNALLVNGGGGDLGINSTKRSRISFTEVIARGNRLQIRSEERWGIHYWASFQRGDHSDNHYTSWSTSSSQGPPPCSTTIHKRNEYYIHGLSWRSEHDYTWYKSSLCCWPPFPYIQTVCRSLEYKECYKRPSRSTRWRAVEVIYLIIEDFSDIRNEVRAWNLFTNHKHTFRLVRCTHHIQSHPLVRHRQGRGCTWLL